MENIEKHSHEEEFQTKSRSLDLKSLYQPRLSEVNEKKHFKRKISVEDADVQRVKKIRKRVSISSLRNGSTESRKCLDEVYDGQLNGQDLNIVSNLTQKSNWSCGINKPHLNFGENVMQIPKRKRGLVGRKKLAVDQVSVKQSDDKEDLIDPSFKLIGNGSVARSDSWETREKIGNGNLEENIISGENSTHHLKVEDGHGDQLVVVNSGVPTKAARRKSKKKKNVLEGSGEAKFSADNSTKRCNDSREDEEANLEENAARMLSSRFDPSFTGFPANSKASPNGLPVSLSNGHDFISHHSSLSGVEYASVDASGRTLRPRKQGKEKKRSRKRRHFYEVLYRDSDAYWVLNRRIKMFWPLDQIWYFGRVNDYNKEIKLHHVKYDDREEEWVDLQNERFKLLLLPTEVQGKASRKKTMVGDKISDAATGRLQSRKDRVRKDLTNTDEGSGAYMDSEPIISWLARSSHRVKSAPSHVLKKQKTSDRGCKLAERASNESSHDYSLESYKNKFYCKSDFLERVGPIAEKGRLGKFASGILSCQKEGKQPIVYYRRKQRKASIELSHFFEGDNVSRMRHRSGWDVARGYVARGSVARGSVARGSVAYVSSMAVEDAKENGDSLRRSDLNGPLSCTDDEGFLVLPIIKSKQSRFELSLLGYSFLLNSVKVENSGLFYALVLLQYGTLISTWPNVYLEMLFVDNVAGLRFLLFEGCLRQAVALVFLVLTMFNLTEKHGKYVDSQLPLTSIKFKISRAQGITKQHVFTFCNFSEITNSQWIHLDNSLQRCCLLTKQISLAECTCGNIKALSGPNCVAHGSMQLSSVKGLQKKYMQEDSISGARDAAFINIIHPSLFHDSLNINFSPFSHSFTASPASVFDLHLKKLVERFCDFTDKGAGITFEKSLKNSNEVDAWRRSLPKLGTHHLDFCDRNWTKSSENSHFGNLKDAKSCGTSLNPEYNCADDIEQLPLWRNQHVELRNSGFEPRHSANKQISDAGDDSFLNEHNVNVATYNEVDKPIDEELHSAKLAIESNWKTNTGIILSPNPTAPRSTWHRNKNNLSSSGFLSHGWSDGKGDLFNNGFGNGPKKPRTQFLYSLPFGSVDYSLKTKNNHQKGLPHKRIRRASEKRSLDISRGSPRNLELLFCHANLLITLADRGWRECGARIVLELLDHNEWKLVVKISGVTKYSYKAHQFLQPGSTNRYTHAMMWKGGKDWMLEFPDRSQWTLFKEMHEECYNRNLRAASVKNIPIPGVQLIEENDENITEGLFFRFSSKYFQQVETDVEMALNPSSILYDMDSDDEQWIVNCKSSAEVGSCGLGEISDGIFEKTIDMFEKAAYTRRRDQFTTDEIEELTCGVGAINIIMIIYEYWQKKRQRKGLPLIRHLQPPLWEMYQQQLKEWEISITKNSTALPNGFHEKASSAEKPPMFAFCLKPRGLEVSNKGSKQRSNRKFSAGGHNVAIPGDHDTFHGFGRRLNGFGLADERIAYSGYYNHELLDDSPLVPISPRLLFSLQDPGNAGYNSMGYDEFERNLPSKFHRSKSKKYSLALSSNDIQTTKLYNQRTISNRNGIDWRRHQYQEDLRRHYIQQLDPSDADELRLRDASGAAKHARNMAQLKRERARQMHFRAELAIHKAVVALMTAEAIKTSSEDTNDGDG